MASAPQFCESYLKLSHFLTSNELEPICHRAKLSSETISNRSAQLEESFESQSLQGRCR